MWNIKEESIQSGNSKTMHRDMYTVTLAWIVLRSHVY